jgi:hypothetical protein
VLTDAVGTFQRVEKYLRALFRPLFRGQKPQLSCVLIWILKCSGLVLDYRLPRERLFQHAGLALQWLFLISKEEPSPVEKRRSDRGVSLEERHKRRCCRIRIHLLGGRVVAGEAYDYRPWLTRDRRPNKVA